MQSAFLHYTFIVFYIVEHYINFGFAVGASYYRLQGNK